MVVVGFSYIYLVIGCSGFQVLFAMLHNLVKVKLLFKLKLSSSNHLYCY